MEFEKTIAAIATARGQGGVAIVRISGTGALAVLKKSFSHRGKYESHRMYHGYVLNESGEKIDEALGVYMAAPRSYTGEDVCEIQCHGGDVCARRVLEQVLRAGAVPAGPGEFTRRAFLNGRMDLSQAEAVMQLVSAGSEAAARASLRQLTGGVSGRIRALMDQLHSIRALIEAGDDFPEEMEETETAGQVRSQVQALADQLRKLCDPRAARIITGGSRVVLCGRPNAGKSSLLNALLGAEAAIVTDVPGTTRDVLTGHLELGGVDCEISDTAGLRDTADPVEQIGVRRAEEALTQADVVLAVVDASREFTPEDARLLEIAPRRTLCLLNKTDLTQKVDADFISGEYNIPVLQVSAVTGAGLDQVKQALLQRINPGEAPIVAQRHLEAMARALQAAEDALSALDAGFPADVCGVDLARCGDALSEITGENARESVIDRVFRDFCVGK